MSTHTWTHEHTHTQSLTITSHLTHHTTDTTSTRTAQHTSPQHLPPLLSLSHTPPHTRLTFLPSTILCANSFRTEKASMTRLQNPRKSGRIQLVQGSKNGMEPTGPCRVSAYAFILHTFEDITNRLPPSTERKDGKWGRVGEKPRSGNIDRAGMISAVDAIATQSTQPPGA